MKPKSLITILTAIFLAVTVSTSIGQEFSFSLPDLDGKTIKLEKDSADSKSEQLTLVCFLGTECPLARLYASRLNRFSQEFPQVRFIGIFSNHQDSVKDVAAYQTKYKLEFRLAKDTKNVVADKFEAERTPEVFLLDRELKLVYRGRIDDQYQPGIAKSNPNRQDLQIAIAESLAGKPVSHSRTQPEGCLIGRVKTASGDGSITYANQVSRLLQNHCAECHREGEIGPMKLMDYDEVVGWAEMIVEVVKENRMPPWHADPEHGDFINERRMTTAEKQMLKDWVAAGSPKGDLDQLPPPRQFAKTSQWRLPKDPDVVVEMREKPFTIPAQGTVEYQYFVVDPKFEEDKWVTSAEILPGNRSVLHHSIVFIRPPDGGSFRGIGWLAAYVPGQSAPAFNPKFGRKIPAGSKLVFQQHYTPVGQETTDMTRIGLVFGQDEQIENEVFTLVAMDQQFLIPPQAKNHKVSAEFEYLPEQGSLLGISPHMHYRGKSFEVIAKVKDPNSESDLNSATTQTILNVPNYDFNWQHIYQLKNPIPISTLESLEFIAAFDNSSENAANPDPDQHVSWGDQTWEEMAVVFAMVSAPRKAEAKKVEWTEPTAEEQVVIDKYNAFIKTKVDAFTDDYLNHFDENKDGQITLSEYPRGIRRFGRWRLDNNSDGVITREEISINVNEHFMNKFPHSEFDPMLKKF